MYIYHAFGLRIHSALALPELPAAVDDADTTGMLLEIECEQATDIQRTGAPSLKVGVGSCRIHRPGFARCTIERGERIRLEVDSATQGSELRAFLLGPVFTAALYLRGVLPLHASAVLIDGTLWAFTGPSGAGKSTLAALLHLRHGCPLFADDLLVHDPAGPAAQVAGGALRMRLWEDTLEALAVESKGLARVVPARPKYHLPLTEARVAGPRPLAGLCVLERGPEDSVLELAPLSGLERVQAVFGALHRPVLGRQLLADPLPLESACVALAGAVPVLRLRRAWNVGQIEATAAELYRQLASYAAHSQPVSPSQPVDTFGRSA